MHGQFLKDIEGNDLVNSWKWLSRGELKGHTEALICSAQEHSLHTNYVNFKIDQSIESPLCRMCGEMGESVTHIVSEGAKLAQMPGKEVEKLEKYQLLKDEIIKMKGAKTVVIVPVIIGALSVVSKNFEKNVKKLEIDARVEIMQKTALLGTARLLRKVLSLGM